MKVLNLRYVHASAIDNPSASRFHFMNSPQAYL